MDQLFFRPIAGMYRTACRAGARRDSQHAAAYAARPAESSSTTWRRAEPPPRRRDAQRFALNSTISLGGLLDMPPTTSSASQFHLAKDAGRNPGGLGRRRELLPDAALLRAVEPARRRRHRDRQLHRPRVDPVRIYGPSYGPMARSVLTALDARSRAIDALDEVERTSIDFYATLRSLYRQRRIDEINNGQPSGNQNAPDDHERPVESVPGAAVAGPACRYRRRRHRRRCPCQGWRRRIKFHSVHSNERLLAMLLTRRMAGRFLVVTAVAVTMLSALAGAPARAAAASDEAKSFLQDTGRPDDLDPESEAVVAAGANRRVPQPVLPGLRRESIGQFVAGRSWSKATEPQKIAYLQAFEDRDDPDLGAAIRPVLGREADDRPRARGRQEPCCWRARSCGRARNRFASIWRSRRGPNGWKNPGHPSPAAPAWRSPSAPTTRLGDPAEQRRVRRADFARCATSARNLRQQANLEESRVARIPAPGAPPIGAPRC